MRISQLIAGTVLLICTATASATLVEVRMSGFVPIAPTSNGTVPSLDVGSLITTSFLLDTSSAGSADLIFGTYGGPGFPAASVLGNFDIGNVLTRDIFLAIDGVNAGPAPGATGMTRYDGFLSSPVNGTDYDMYMSLTTPGFSFSFQDFNAVAGGAITEAALLGAADPLAMLLHSYGTPPAFAYLSGTFGQFAFAVDSLTIRDVPEPATLGLLGAALALMLIYRRRTTKLDCPPTQL